MYCKTRHYTERDQRYKKNFKTEITQKNIKIQQKYITIQNKKQIHHSSVYEYCHE